MCFVYFCGLQGLSLMEDLLLFYHFQPSIYKNFRSFLFLMNFRQDIFQESPEESNIEHNFLDKMARFLLVEKFSVAMWEVEREPCYVELHLHNSY